MKDKYRTKIIIALISSVTFTIVAIIKTGILSPEKKDSSSVLKAPSNQISHEKNSPNIQGVDGGVKIIIDNGRNSEQYEDRN